MSPKLELWDIFSYSCMNCLRSFDYIRYIDGKYKKYGLKTTIIHVPEWKFEKQKNNIKTAIKKYKIKLPKIIDKDKKLLKKLKINFWPAQLLIKDKKLIYKHIGEGGYKKLEGKIIKFLGIKTKRLFDKEPKYSNFPTIYAGKRKNGRVLKLNKNNDVIKFGTIYINGKWKQKNEFLENLEDNSSIITKAKGVIINMVASSLKNPIKVEIMLNSKNQKSVTIKNPGLYAIAKSKSNKEKTIEIKTKAGLKIYSFSFK